MPMRILSLALAALAAACGGADAPATAAPATPVAPASPSDDPSCPVAVPGTSVAVENATGGAALVFATTGDVAEVKRRAGEMARIHNEEHAKMGPLPTGGEGSGHDHGAHQHGEASGGGSTGAHGGHKAAVMVQTHSHAQVEETDSGARVVFHVAPDQLNAIESELRQHAQHLSSGRCSM